MSAPVYPCTEKAFERPCGAPAAWYVWYNVAMLYAYLCTDHLIAELQAVNPKVAWVQKLPTS